jgi:putative hydrolases of HD superfamily
METINKLRKFYELKNVERVNSVGKRKESTAEHSWSCLILADYFLTEMNDYSINRSKVYELLMYHDVVEIESGDVCISDEAGRVGKKEREMQAMHVLVDHIPEKLGQKFVSLFNEFEEQKTREAKFAKAIDMLDAQIHEMDYKEDWKGWTEEFLRSKKQHLFEEFPLMMEVFEKVIGYLVKEGYFNQ